MQTKLDLSSFKRAVAALDEVLQVYKQDSNPFMRDACIQRFEFTYELAWKMLKRYLETNSANPSQVDEMTSQTLIRTGSEMGLLKSGWDTWAKYRKARSTTSHVYDESKALEVFAVIPDFYLEAVFLLNALESNAT